jgi:dTDP-4-amino-4,6-dideoxygalactose transaminase
VTTIARYSPAVTPGAWVRWLTGGPAAAAEARRDNLDFLASGSGASFALELENARQAIRVYLQEIAPGEVLLPAQSCSVLAESVRLAGHQPRFLDADELLATPSAAQYASAVGPGTAAVILAPLYGYLQEDWAPLVKVLGSKPLLLDLAQGLGLNGRLPSALTVRADALVYSFGLGKGVDTGGSVLLTREPHQLKQAERSGIRGHLFVLSQAAAVRAAEVTGTYRHVLSRLEQESEAAKDVASSFLPRRPPASIHLLWRAQLRRLCREFERATVRAAILGEGSAMRRTARGLETFMTSQSAPLRQVLRLRDQSARDQLLTRLRARGIDCAAAGESLPVDAARRYPQAVDFGASSIRLPFLGRLSDARFASLQRILEDALVDLSD